MDAPGVGLRAGAATGASGSRLARATIALCSLALLAPLLEPLVTGRVFVYNDLAWFHLPMRYLYQQALQSGDTVLWTPSILSGLYLHGEGQVGAFHPLHQLIYRALPLGAALNLELIASYVAAFAGMVWLLRRLRLGAAAALFGAMLFAFSGFNLLHHHHVNMVAVIAHLPWLLAAADVLLVDERPSVRRLALAALAAILASSILLGFPQAVGWNAITMAAFIIFRAGQAGRWRMLLPCAAAVLLGILLGAIQLLPTADAAANSTRTSVTDEFALSFSLHPLNLIQVWSPYFFERGAYSQDDALLFHEFGIYSGAILPVALIWVWIRRGALPHHRGLVTALTIFAAVALILALGRFGGVAGVLAQLPVFQLLRAPVRYIMLVQFALAILAAVAVDDLLAIASRRTPAPNRRVRLLWIPAVMGIVTTLALNTGLLPYGRHTFAAFTSAAIGVGLVTMVSVLVWVAARGQRWAIPALAVVTMVDLWAWGIAFVRRDPPQRIARLLIAIPPAPEDTAHAYAFMPQHTNLLVMRGYRLTSGYSGLFPQTNHPLGSEATIRLSGTRWYFTDYRTRMAVEGSVPRVRLLDEQARDGPGAVRLTEDRPGRLSVRVDAPARRVVAFTERFHDGWTGTVNDAPVRTVPVEGDFLGVLLEPGVHHVRLRFMPRSFVFGAILSAVGVAVLAGLVLAASGNRVRRPRTSPPLG